MIHQNHRKETKYYGVANERDGIGKGRMEEVAFKNGHGGLLTV